jgi:hypothetical protein
MIFLRVSFFSAAAHIALSSHQRHSNIRAKSISGKNAYLTGITFQRMDEKVQNRTIRYIFLHFGTVGTGKPRTIGQITFQSLILIRMSRRKYDISFT